MRALADNPYEAHAREQKATRIAAFLRAKGVPAGVADALDQDGRNAAAALAGARLPVSDATWQRVVDLLDVAENLPAPGDPFKGLPA